MAYNFHPFVFLFFFLYEISSAWSRVSKIVFLVDFSYLFSFSHFYERWILLCDFRIGFQLLLVIFIDFVDKEVSLRSVMHTFPECRRNGEN